MADSRHAPSLLSPALRRAVLVTAGIDVLIGLAFFLGPELGITLWPKPISPVLMRFIGSIVLANGIGAGLAVRQGTWEGARVLFAVALAYGVLILPALLYHLVFQEGTPDVFWIYAAVDALFLVPIGMVYVAHDRAWRAARTAAAPGREPGTDDAPPIRRHAARS